MARNVPNGDTLRSLGELLMSGPIGLGNRDVNNVNTLSSNNWRASSVPAAAVIPTPVMYFEVAAVKTLVVETGAFGGTTGCVGVVGLPASVRSGPHRLPLGEATVAPWR